MDGLEGNEAQLTPPNGQPAMEAAEAGGQPMEEAVRQLTLPSKRMHQRLTTLLSVPSNSPNNPNSNRPRTGFLN